MVKAQFLESFSLNPISSPPYTFGHAISCSLGNLLPNSCFPPAQKLLPWVVSADALCSAPWGSKAAGILSLGHTFWEDVVGCRQHQGPPWPEATLEEWTWIRSHILAPVPSPFLAQDGLVAKYIPGICTYRPSIHRPKSKNLQFLGKNQEWFSLLQKVAISHLGLGPSLCIISVGHEPSSAHIHLQAKTQSHMIFIMLRKVMQFKTF